MMNFYKTSCTFRIHVGRSSQVLFKSPKTQDEAEYPTPFLTRGKFEAYPYVLCVMPFSSG